MNKRRKKNKTFKLNGMLIFSIIVIVFVFGYSLSKYVIKQESMHIQSARNFYFNSDILSIDNTEYILNDWNGTDEYTVEVNLNNFEDGLRCTQDSILYEFEATSDNTDVTISTSLNSLQNMLAGNTKSTENIVISIIPKREFTNGETVNVNLIANSISPYTKTIQANLKITVENISYKYDLVDEIDSQYAKLYIENINQNKTITISYDSTKMILEDNGILYGKSITNNSNNKSVTLELEQNEVYEISFIKKQSDTKLVLGTDVIIY